MNRKIYYLFHSGKNCKFLYYLRSYIREAMPRWCTQIQLKSKLAKLDDRADKAYILERVNYYNKLTPTSPIDATLWNERAVEVCQQPMTNQSTYYHDAMEIARYFRGHLKWMLRHGDITTLLPLPTIIKSPLPTILKSRPLGNNNQNSVILKLDKVRHFLFVNDTKSWRDKKDMAIFRGDIGNEANGDDKPNRRVFMTHWKDHPMVDAASTEGRDPVEDIRTIQKELEVYDPELVRKPAVTSSFTMISRYFLEIP